MFKFTRLANAQYFAGRAIKPMVVILGDDRKYWVVTLGRGQTLVRQGYELAE